MYCGYTFNEGINEHPKIQFCKLKKIKSHLYYHLNGLMTHFYYVKLCNDSKIIYNNDNHVI